MPSEARAVATVLLVSLGLPTVVEAQQPAPPSAPGTVVVGRGPLDVDTIPILCVDAARPDRGFVTETGDPEWAPTLDFSLRPTTAKGDSFRVRFADGSATYDRTIPRGTYTEGPLLGSVNLVPWDSGRGVDLYFTARCDERLHRKKKGR